MTLWLIGTLALAGGDPCADAKKVDAAKAELKALFDADQADHEANVEKLEKLEQLRMLENGMPMQVVEACQDVPGGVDTEQDLERVRQLFGRR